MKLIPNIPSPFHQATRVNFVCISHNTMQNMTKNPYCSTSNYFSQRNLETGCRTIANCGSGFNINYVDTHNYGSGLEL